MMDSFEWIETSIQQQPVNSPARTKRKFRAKRYEFIGWGSRPLIEFLESIGKGIGEKISRHDVTTIINDYVRINNLVHPSKKKRIVCDDRLHSIFGRKTIGRIKIHDLLEQHFFENLDRSDDDDCSYSSDEKENLSSRRENGGTPVRKFVQKPRILVSPKSSFAAIVPANISLVYLRRSLVEDLVKDSETFESKLIGSFVRIKSDPHDYLQKNTHQLVQVLGVDKVSIPGDSGTRFVLRVSNVMKDVSICLLSDEMFSEEECKDLDLRVKHGSIKRLTIAEVQQKVDVLHVDITKQWLSREISLLQNLIDQANEKGWRKELDKYLEKKMLLQNAEEQSRILLEIPQVIAEETELKGIDVGGKKGDNTAEEGDETKLQMRWEVSDVTNRGGVLPSSEPNAAENGTVALMSNVEEFAGFSSIFKESRHCFVDEQPPQPVDYDSFDEIEEQPPKPVEYDSFDEIEEQPTKPVEYDNLVEIEEQPTKPIEFDSFVEIEEQPTKPVEYDSFDKIELINAVEKKSNVVIDLSDDDEDDEPPNAEYDEAPRAECIEAPRAECIEAPRAGYVEAPKVEDEENDWNKILITSIWHYLDPQGDVQGPFCLASMKTWNDANYFPSDFKVWKTDQTRDQAVLLNDILSPFL